jgi:uncharacterized alpha-E superfamily protein
VLLRVLGIEPPKQELDVWSLTDLVAYSTDDRGGSSIVEAITAARENAKSAREVTSIESATTATDSWCWAGRSSVST